LGHGRRLRKPAQPAAALLGEHRLKHREHRLRGLGGGRVADKVSKLFAASIDRAHVAAKVVHEDFRRIRAALHHLAFILAIAFLVVALEIVLEHVKEALHDADVIDRGFSHTFIFHDDPLEKSATTAATTALTAHWPRAHGLLRLIKALIHGLLGLAKRLTRGKRRRLTPVVSLLHSKARLLRLLICGRHLCLKGRLCLKSRLSIRVLHSRLRLHSKARLASQSPCLECCQ
jgi:hypothetical protein